MRLRNLLAKRVLRRAADENLPAECRTVVSTVPEQLGQLFYIGMSSSAARLRSSRATFCIAVVLIVPVSPFVGSVGAADRLEPSSETRSTERPTVRVAAVQAKRRLVDWHIKEPVEFLAAVDKNLAELEQIVQTAGKQGCDAHGA